MPAPPSQATLWRKARTCDFGRKEVCTRCTSPTWAVRTRGSTRSVPPTPTARPTAQPSSTWRSLGRLPLALGTARGPRCCQGCLCGAPALWWEVRLRASGQLCGSYSSKLEKMPSIPEEPEQGELERLSMPDFLRPLQDLDVGLAKEAMLECQVTGLPYPTISWFHNGHRIQSSDDRRMTQCRCPGRDPAGVPSSTIFACSARPPSPPSGLPFLTWSGMGRLGEGSPERLWGHCLLP